MSERRFEQSMNSREGVQKYLEDAGIDNPKEWRKAFDLESDEDSKDSSKSINHNFDTLHTYLEGEKRISDEEKIKAFGETEDSVERLELLRTMSLSDAVKCLRDHSDAPGQYHYLANRLDFYQKLFQGKATKRYTTKEYDDKKGQYVEVTKEDPIDASDVSPETIRLGVLRDTLYAAMKGTPELGAVKIATKRINQELIEQAREKEKRGENSQYDTKGIKSVVELFGYYSGIFEGSIGQWADLGELYKKCFEQIQKKYKEGSLDDKQLEHRAVLLTARKLQGAYEYNGIINTCESPYSAGFKEAVAVGQLGHKVMRQMRGMRLKIQSTDFRNVERFIGKSGDNRYDGERRRLNWQLKFLSGNDEEEKQKYVAEQNQREISNQEDWNQDELERINRKFEKSKDEIEQLDLPEKEKQLQLESVRARYENKIAVVNSDYQEQVAYFQTRTAEQLLKDLQERQKLVEQRHEKRKSLAQKALDLHFKINHTGGEYDSKPLAGIVDWINYAPLGTIKRCHKMMQLDMSDETVVEYALADIIAGKRGTTREDLKTVHDLVEKAKGQDWDARQKLEAMMKVGNILAISNLQASLEEVADLAGKSFYGMTEALKMYDLEQVKQFMDQGINLQSITETRKITEKYGHDLAPVEIAEMSAHDIGGLEDALRSFDLDAVRTLLNQDVRLPVAVSVLNNTKQFGYELSITQIANIAKNVDDIEDFTSALRGLPLAEVKKLFSIGISYRDFGTVKESLERHKHKSNFTASLAMAQKLSRHNEYGNLDNALETYSLKEVNEIVVSGSALSAVLDVKNSLAEKEVNTTLAETIQFAKLSGEWNQGWNVQKAIDTFGIDSVRKITSKNCRLDKAVEVNGYINNERSSSNVSEELRESFKKGGLDVVIAIAKAGNMEVAVKTIEAGFTIEEITRFPFLISPLVTKK